MDGTAISHGFSYNLTNPNTNPFQNFPFTLPTKNWVSLDVSEVGTAFSLGMYASPNMSYSYETRDAVDRTYQFTIPQYSANGTAYSSTTVTGTTSQQYYANKWAPTAALYGKNYYVANIANTTTVNDSDQWWITTTDGIKTKQVNQFAINRVQDGHNLQFLHLDTTVPAPDSYQKNEGYFESDTQAFIHGVTIGSGTREFERKHGVTVPQTDADWREVNGQVTINGQVNGSDVKDLVRRKQNYRLARSNDTYNGTFEGEYNYENGIQNGTFVNFVHMNYAIANGTTTNDVYSESSQSNFIATGTESLEEDYDFQKYLVYGVTTTGQGDKYKGHLKRFSTFTGPSTESSSYVNDGVLRTVEMKSSETLKGPSAINNSDIGKIDTVGGWRDGFKTDYSYTTNLTGDMEDKFSIRQKMSYDSIAALASEWNDATQQGKDFNPVTPIDYEESIKQYSWLKWEGNNNQSWATNGPPSLDLSYFESYSNQHRIDYYGHLIDGEFEYVGGKPVSGQLDAMLESEPEGYQNAEYNLRVTSRNYTSQNVHFANQTTNRSNRREKTVTSSKNDIFVKVVGGKFETKTTQGVDFTGTTFNSGLNDWNKIIAPVERDRLDWNSEFGKFAGSKLIEQTTYDGKLVSGKATQSQSESGLLHVNSHYFVSLDNPGISEGFVSRDSKTDHNSHFLVAHESEVADGKFVLKTYNVESRPDSTTKFDNVRSLTNYILVPGNQPPPGGQGMPPLVRIGQEFNYQRETGTTVTSNKLETSKSATGVVSYSRDVLNNFDSTIVSSWNTAWQNNGNSLDASGHGLITKSKHQKALYGLDFEGKNEKLVTLKIDDVTDTFAFSRGITSGPNWFSESESTTKSIVGYGLNGIDQNVTEKWINYSQLDGKGRSTDSPDWTAYGSTTGKNEWESKNSLTMPNPGQIWSGWHGIQIIGGVAEFVAGAGVTFVTGGWATPFGVLMMANGLDQIITGGQNWIIGSHSMSVFESAGYSAARWAGASERTAHVVGAFTPLAINLGSLTGVWSVAKLGLKVENVALQNAETIGPLIGRTGYTLDEFTSTAFNNYQNFYNQSYDTVMQLVAQGSIPNIRRVIGIEVDTLARQQMRFWLSSEGISEGANSIISVNRRLYDPALNGLYRIPDIYIPGRSIIFEGSLAFKTHRAKQIIDFRNFSGNGKVIIVRPAILGGSYGIVFR